MASDQELAAGNVESPEVIVERALAGERYCRTCRRWHNADLFNAGSEQCGYCDEHDYYRWEESERQHWAAEEERREANRLRYEEEASERW